MKKEENKDCIKGKNCTAPFCLCYIKEKNIPKLKKNERRNEKEI